MASLQDFVQKYIAEATSKNADKNQAAKEIAAKLRSLSYTGRDDNIPKVDLLGALRVVKGSANDSHLEVLETVIAILEQGGTD
jgi:uncharacterized protein (DUF2342 family)